MWPTTWHDNSEFGAPVAALGDVSGDGVPDFAVGSTLQTLDDVYFRAGQAFVYDGATRQILHALQSPQPVPQGRFGRVVPAQGDLDGDGRPDLFVEDPGAFKVRAFSGAAGTLIRSYDMVAGGVPAGQPETAGSAGDLTGDGVPDLLLGHGPTNRVRILDGASGEVADAFTGDNGWPVGGGFVPLGDITNNGSPDYAAGVESVTIYEGSTRAVLGRIRTGSRDGWMVWPGQPAGGPSLPYPPPVPAPIALGADIDGDGLQDLAVGRSDSNQVRIHSQASLEVIRVLHNPDTTLTRFGRTVINTGDLNGDGVSDLGIGALTIANDPVLQLPNSRILLFDGLSGAHLATVEPPITNAGPFFGRDVTSVGDINSDGVSDLVVGIHWPGLTFVYSGAHVVEVEKPPTEMEAGLSVAPNPADAAVTIRYTLSRAASVRLSVHDTLGRQVRVLEEGPRTAGDHRIRVDTRELRSGTYVVRLADDRVVSTRLLAVTR